MAEFNADFPDDAVEEDGEIVAFPGCNVATTIAELFQRAGYKCKGQLADGVHWGFHVTVQNRPSMWFSVHTFEDGEYYLFAEDTSPLDRFFPSAKRKYHTYLRELGRLLSSDSRFSDVRWFSKKDAGHDHPMPAPIADD